MRGDPYQQHKAIHIQTLEADYQAGSGRTSAFPDHSRRQRPDTRYKFL